MQASRGPLHRTLQRMKADPIPMHATQKQTTPNTCAIALIVEFLLRLPKDLKLSPASRPASDMTLAGGGNNNVDVRTSMATQFVYGRELREFGCVGGGGGSQRDHVRSFLRHWSLSLVVPLHNHVHSLGQGHRPGPARSRSDDSRLRLVPPGAGVFIQP